MIVRTEEERETLREGGKRLARILHSAATFCAPGVMLRDVDTYTRERMQREGVKPSFLGYGKPPFPAVLCMSVNEGVVHGIPGDYILRDGDIVTLDAGVWFGGLCTDSAITIGIGRVSERDQALITIAKKARDAQVMAAVAGNTVADLARASEKVIRDAGYSFPEVLGGHGVGASVHESPFIPSGGRGGESYVLREGEVLALEPIAVDGRSDIDLADDEWLYYTVDKSRSAQFEHTVIVGRDSAEVLTELSQ